MPIQTENPVFETLTTAEFEQVFRPENVSAATSNHNERFWCVCVVLRGVTVVQTRRILPAAVPENLVPEFTTTRINPSIMTTS